MKKVMTTLAVIIGFIFSVLIVFTMSGREMRETEISNALAAAMDNTAKTLADRREYIPVSDDELAAAFTETLMYECGTVKEKTTVHIIQADSKRGLIDAEITAAYTHPNGKPATVTVHRTILLEQYDVPELEMHTVTFMVNGEVFRKYEGNEKKAVTVPPTPKGEIRTIWKEASGKLMLPGEKLYLSADEVYSL